MSRTRIPPFLRVAFVPETETPEQPLSDMATFGTDITGVRKSAILLLSLGQDQAAEIL